MKKTIRDNIIEEDEAEALALDGSFEVAIAFSVTWKDRENEPVVRVFPSLRKQALEYLERFGGSPEEAFSDEARGWAKKVCGEFLLRHEFELCEDTGDYFFNYRLTKPCEAFVDARTVRLESTEGLENLTEYDFDAMTEFGHICFAAVLDGKIVSAACTNYPCYEDDEENRNGVEIGVETAADYRGRGFAASNAAALAGYLAERGFPALYECEADNLPSRAVIEKLGGERFARNFCVAGQAIEPESPTE